jgi:hypothetical protein
LDESCRKERGPRRRGEDHGGLEGGTVYVGPGLTPFSTVGIMAIHYSFHIIFSLRVTHPKLDLPPAPGITFLSPRAALSLSLHIRLLLFVQSRLRNHSVPTSCSVRPAHGRPLSQSVANQFISTSVFLSPPPSRLPTSTTIPSLFLPRCRIPSSPSHLLSFLPG